MKNYPSITSQIDEKLIFKTINKNFNIIAPYYFKLVSNWLVGAYKVYKDIDKFVIIIYLINKDLIFFRRNGLIVDYDTFYKNSTLEIEKINISDISRDLEIPKESVRRKVLELEKKGVISKNGKKIFVNRSAFYSAQAQNTLRDVSSCLYEFNKLLKKENLSEKIFEINEISDSIKKNFSFCWYQFYKFLFVFTTRWRVTVSDLETMCIGFIFVVNSSHIKSFRAKDLNLKSYRESISSADERGVNAMSISDITGIPRPTVVRKLKFLIDNDFLTMNKKKLITLNLKNKALKITEKIQNANIRSFSDFTFRVFNQIKIIKTN
tara:strand:- start:1276 stop:2241 length:966 start_codon:yes stop_codon:yes gene_type:complete